MADEGFEVIWLRGDRASLALEIAPAAAPVWRYFGPDLGVGVRPPAPASDLGAPAGFSLDGEGASDLFPALGGPGFGDSALRAHRGGQDFAQAFTLKDLAWPVTDRAVRLVLDDDVTAVRALIDLAIDPASDVFTVRTTIENLGRGALQVDALAAAALVLPARVNAVRFHTGRHAREFIPETAPLGRGDWRLESRRGLTSHDAFPGAVVTAAETGFDAGLAFGAQIAWSGNHAQVIQPLDDGRRRWLLGAWLAPGEVSLAPGERLVSPEVWATASDAGLNGVARNFHRAARGRLVWPGGRMAPRPVHLNTWEGVYFDHRIEDLKSLADEAARLGVERFVLDDGWFEGRRDDTSALGDWRADPERYPEGLAPLSAHVRALGMSFGLWVEPEMVSRRSQLFAAHPDWILRTPGREPVEGRHQLVLDLARPEVREHLFAAIEAVVASASVSYLKWDHNRALAYAGGADGRAGYLAQVAGAYALMDRLRARFPDLEIEVCAGGGGRIDPGWLSRAHRFWTSDCLDAVSRLEIHRGFLQYLPPELMGAHVGAARAHTTGRTQSIGFRAAVALGGHFGIELDPRSLDPADRARLAGWIAFYKRLRPHLHSGETRLGETRDGKVWQAHGERDDFLLLLYQASPSAQRAPADIVLPFVDTGRLYRLERLRPPGDPRPRPTGAAFFDRLEQAPQEVHGAWLAGQGLPSPPLRAETCAVFRLSAS